MGFVTQGYTLDSGDLGSLKISTMKLPQYGSPVAGPLNETAKIYVNKNNKRYGVRARYALYSRVIGSGEDTAVKYVSFAKATLADLLLSPNTVTYRGFTWNYVRQTGEDQN